MINLVFGHVTKHCAWSSLHRFRSFPHFPIWSRLHYIFCPLYFPSFIKLVLDLDSYFYWVCHLVLPSDFFSRQFTCTLLILCVCGIRILRSPQGDMNGQKYYCVNKGYKICCLGYWQHLRHHWESVTSKYKRNKNITFIYLCHFVFPPCMCFVVSA